MGTENPFAVGATVGSVESLTEGPCEGCGERAQGLRFIGREFISVPQRG